MKKLPMFALALSLGLAIAAGCKSGANKFCPSCFCGSDCRCTQECRCSASCRCYEGKRCNGPVVSPETPSDKEADASAPKLAPMRPWWMP